MTNTYDPELEELYCPASLRRGIRELHNWVTVTPYDPDPTRPLDYDMGVLIYADTQTPVYSYPYTRPSAARTNCTACGREKK